MAVESMILATVLISVAFCAVAQSMFIVASEQ